MELQGSSAQLQPHGFILAQRESGEQVNHYSPFENLEKCSPSGLSWVMSISRILECYIYVFNTQSVKQIKWLKYIIYMMVIHGSCAISEKEVNVQLRKQTGLQLWSISQQ